MKRDKMIRTSVQLPADYIAEIRRLADREGESMSDVIREAICTYILVKHQFGSIPLSNFVRKIQTRLVDGGADDGEAN